MVRDEHLFPASATEHTLIGPPTYPLDRDAFRRALRTGHGRALIHARRYGLKGFEDDVLEAAIQDLRFDGQLEPSREVPIAELCAIAGIVERLLDKDPTGNDDCIEHHCEVLAKFHAEYPDRVIQVLKESMRPWPGCHSLFPVDPLLEVGGRDALLFVARRFGELLIDGSVERFDEYLFFAYEEVHGKGKAWIDLDAMAGDDPLVRACFDARRDRDQELLEMKLERDARRRAGEAAGKPEPKTRFSWPGGARPTIEQSVRDLTSGDFNYFYPWTKTSTLEERDAVEQLLQTVDDPNRIRDALRCLREHGFPNFEPGHLRFLHHENDEVRWWAGEVLANNSSPLIREEGLRRIDESEFSLGVTLLTHSALPEDTDRILSALEEPGDRDAVHDRVLALLEMAKDRPEMNPERLLQHVYEWSPCGNCHHKAVDAMKASDSLPAWIQDELQADMHAWGDS